MTPEFTLIVIVVIFGSSLAGAFVLFKILRSTALITKVGYQAGGALAGFLLIYSALYYSFQHSLQTAGLWEPDDWTIVGTVKRTDTNNHEKILIKVLPPKPFALTDESGFFRLTHVEITKEQAKGEIWPEITIHSDGYFPRTISIKAENAEIRTKRRRIDLEDIATISPSPSNGGGQNNE